MRMVLFVGDDWAEDHHDVEVQDATGRRLGKARLPEGMAGIARLHALIGEFTDPDDEAGAGQVLVGIETDRGGVGGGVGRGRVSGVRGQPDAGGPLPGAARHVGGQERRWRRARAGRHGAHRCPPAAPGGWGHRAGRGDQGGGPGAPVHDLGPDPACAAAPFGAAGVLPRRVGGIPGPGRGRRVGAARRGTGPPRGGRVVAQPRRWRAQAGPAP